MLPSKEIKYFMIVAMCNSRGIGHTNNIPWHSKKDLRYFSKLTRRKSNNAIIMGRNTWNSLPKKPLDKRLNIILTRNITTNDKNTDNIKFVTSLTQVNDECMKRDIDEAWVIGGEKIYSEYLNQTDYDIESIYVTKFNYDFECDVFFPEISDKYQGKIIESIKENNIKIDFMIYN